MRHYLIEQLGNVGDMAAVDETLKRNHLKLLRNTFLVAVYYVVRGGSNILVRG